MRTLIGVAASLVVLCACGTAEVVLPEPLTVVYINPSHGATGVAPGEPTFLVVFNDAVVEDVVDAEHFVVREKDSGNEVSLGKVMRDEGNPQSVVMLPAATLKNDTDYEIVLKDDIAGENKGELGVELVTRFKTREDPVD